jgi:putative NADPH-quinone reductase
LKRNILGFTGVAPVKSTVIGSIEGMSDKQRADWLDRMRALGERAE